MKLRFALTFCLALSTGLTAITPALSDDVRILSSPADAAQAWIDVIDGAKSELFVSTYVFRNDRSGKIGLAKLRDAVRRGVKVTLVVDDVLNLIPAPMIAHLQQEGIWIGIYSPGKLNFVKYVSYRLHAKLIASDGVEMISGDRNWGNEYLGASDHPFISRDAYVRGEAVKAAHEYAKEVRNHPDVVPADPGRQAPEAIRKAAEELDQVAARAPSRFLEAGKNWRNTTRSISDVNFLHEHTTGKAAESGTAREVLRSLASAKKRIILENPYYVLTPEMKKVLREAAERGVQITVHANSVKSNNQPLVATRWPDNREFLASLGAEVWELPDPKPLAERAGLRSPHLLDEGTNAALHSKTYVIDDEVLITSMNLDYRSQNLNCETGVRIRDPKFAAELADEILTSRQTYRYRLTASQGRVLVPVTFRERAYGCLTRFIEFQL